MLGRKAMKTSWYLSMLMRSRWSSSRPSHGRSPAACRRICRFCMRAVLVPRASSRAGFEGRRSGEAIGNGIGTAITHLHGWDPGGAAAARDTALLPDVLLVADRDAGDTADAAADRDLRLHAARDLFQLLVGELG